ncbi:MAG: double-cubane-cluster-containing anaerobic reductase [Thermoguttaceae bacterium]|nr:double-cubane-cluster-containing anaerobic reductase [Thermoguttaceae bacterium]
MPAKSCGANHNAEAATACPPPTSCCRADGSPGAPPATPCEHFGRMIQNCLEYARAAKAEGRPIVGILCEYTPRELILAGGGVPVCLCGGSAQTIPAAETQLPANLCPLIKSTFGYHLERSNPFLEMADLIVAETTCDGKKKMYELLAETRPVYVLELPQKVDDPDALAHWRAELCKFRTMLEQRWGVEITDDRIREAVALMNRERALRRRLASLMAADRPPLTGRQLLELKSSISGMPADFEQYEKAFDLLSRKPACTKAHPPVRVLMTGVPLVHGAERVLEIIEESGGLVVAMENCTGLKPVLDDVDPDTSDPIDALAQRYFHLPCSVMTRNDRRLETLGRLAETYRPQCVIDLIWQACLTYDVESHRVRRYAEEELGVPYLRIETDYSPSDSARIAVRVEGLFETIRQSAERPDCPAAQPACPGVAPTATTVEASPSCPCDASGAENDD